MTISQQFSIHEKFLNEALSLAKLRRGFCSPNPAVGAVLVQNNQIIATGYHHGAGHAHAEVNALKSITKDIAKNSTLYVTLEPCCHHGRTPACTDLIIDKGILKVVYAYSDPNSIVSGRGHKLLLDAEIDCQHYELDEVNDFYRSYDFWQQNARPWITAKLAISQDGKIAGPGGEPQKITGDALKQFTHQCRKEADAILTTAKTVIKDNPKMNVRLNGDEQAKPIYVLDRKLVMPLDADIIKYAANMTIFHQHDIDESRKSALEAIGIKCIAVHAEDNALCIEAIVDIIGNHGIHDLWIEAGSKCFNAFAKSNLLQQAYIYIAPKKYLGPSAIKAFDYSMNDLLATAKKCNIRKFSDDILCELMW